jgi:hypothetical protein
MPVGANAGLAGLNVNVGVNLQQFNAGMAEIEKRGAQVTQNLNSMGSALTTGAGIGAGVALATAALSGLADIAGAASSAIIGLNSDLEQARIGFTAFTGSQRKLMRSSSSYRISLLKPRLSFLVCCKLHAS